MKILLLFFAIASVASAQLVSNPHLDIQVMHYAGTTNKTWYLDGIKGVNDMQVHGTWDERKIGKPKPTSMAQLASVEVAMAWLNSLKTDADKDREKVDSTDKLQAEVIALRKELEALKKEKQR